MSVIVALSSLILSPVMLCTRSVILRRTSSTVWRMFLLYSIPILRSMAVSVLPTSTEIPLVLLSEPVKLPSTPPAVLEAPPPMWTPSTSCAAMPAIEETTLSLIIVAPRSLRSGLSPRCCPDSLISPPSTKFSRVFPEQPRRNQNTSIRTGRPLAIGQGSIATLFRRFYTCSLYDGQGPSSRPSLFLWRVDRRDA